MPRYNNDSVQNDQQNSTKEIIIIEDTPPPLTQSKKRGQEEMIHSSKRQRRADSNNYYLGDTKINHSILIQPQKKIGPPCDDKDGHYIMRPNESLTPQYTILKLLGQCTFGKVVQCYDRVRRTLCAIKVIRAIPKYRDASKIEISVLNTLKKHDPLNLYYTEHDSQCIHLIEWFDHMNHVCLVFELLSQSLFDFLKSNQFKPFPMHQIRQLSKQILTSVIFLHDLKLVHTDLKPENILLVDPTTQKSSDSEQLILQNTEVRLIDFGSATFENDHHSAVVSTRHYRAPEIILGLGWSYPCDLWSIGCIIIELFIGDALFQTHDNREHLAMMEAILGPIPDTMLPRASQEIQKLYKNKQLKYPTAKTSYKSKQCVSALKPLDDIICSSSISIDHAYLLDLLSKLLVYEPNKRISSREALRHPFFQLDIKQ